jgi:hypothetical protein
MIAVGLAGAAPSGERKVVVELFTSQGCASCPPADEILSYLSDKDHVIALALHVDYWDYIGWEDTFARPEHTARQKAYARAAGKRMIYTPQMIVGGRDRVAGARAMAVSETVAAHAGAPRTVALSARREGARIRLQAPLPDLPVGPLTVQLVRYRPEATVRITRGENAGRTLGYSNIVTDWDEVGTWSGEAPLDMIVPAPGEAPAVVLLQKPGPGPILAAVQLR